MFSTVNKGKQQPSAISQPSASWYTPMDVDFEYPNSGDAFQKKESETAPKDSITECVVTTEEVLADYDSLYNEGYFNNEEPTNTTYSQFRETPADAIDVDLTALQQLRENFDGYNEWHRQNSHAEYLQDYLQDAELVDRTPFTTHLINPYPRPPVLKPRPGNTLQSQTNILNRMLRIASGYPPPPPNPSPFRNLPPSDTSGPDCFLFTKKDKDAKD